MLLEQQARAAGETNAAGDVSFIFLMLKGGLSTIDTWDMKPDAPAEFRGEFAPIPTNVAGIQIGDSMDYEGLLGGRPIRRPEADAVQTDHSI